MMKFLEALGTSAKKQPAHGADMRYTRFNYHKTRETSASKQVEQPNHVRRTSMPVAAHRPASNAARAQKPKFDENAQLYSEAHISVSVLRNALPMRFAVMD
ncbi:hypothetical protein [uncultured Roseobacter sp.]|uniref:hypothetical protein n=1 Tax=uncultured Roseobacter sp. TaxID=114847 RepID=UPI00261F6944|nr:hypothetical protein [uncultured Roseobacter sp.]